MRILAIFAVRSFLLACEHIEAGARLTVPEDLDAETAASLVRQGCATEADDEAPGTANWTVPQLRAFAEDEGIDLGDAKAKAAILTRIEAVLAERATV